MTTSPETIAGIEPELVERECGGWLALSPRNSTVRVGVEGQTEQEARDAFAEALLRQQDAARRVLADHGA